MRRWILGTLLFVAVACAGLPAPEPVKVCFPPGLAAIGAQVVSVLPVYTLYGPGLLTDYGSYQLIWIGDEMVAYDEHPELDVGPVWIRKSLDSCEWEERIVGGSSL